MTSRRTLSWALCALGLLAGFADGARAAGTGRLFVKSKPSGAQVFLDDEEEPRGKTPCILRKIPPGTHVLRARLDGHQDASKEIEVQEGALGRASFAFTAGPGGEGEAGAAPDTEETDAPPEPAGAAEADDEADALTETGDASSEEDETPKHIEVDCPVCDGSGLLQWMGCAACNGSGYDGYTRCGECNGTRKVECNCPYCRGEGVLVRGGSQKDCPKCRGKGKLPCPMCRGKGKLKRANPEFSGKPTMPCPYCDASGFDSNARCLRCSGQGTHVSGERSGRIFTYVKVDCPFCGGDGKGPPVCRKCRGAGVVDIKKNPAPCQPCFGTGRLFRPCKACRGQGWIRAR
jgi:DnaJ-class molecular chaperone